MKETFILSPENKEKRALNAKNKKALRIRLKKTEDKISFTKELRNAKGYGDYLKNKYLSL